MRATHFLHLPMPGRQRVKAEQETAGWRSKHDEGKAHRRVHHPSDALSAPVYRMQTLPTTTPGAISISPHLRPQGQGPEQSQTRETCPLTSIVSQPLPKASHTLQSEKPPIKSSPAQIGSASTRGAASTTSTLSPSPPVHPSAKAKRTMRWRGNISPLYATALLPRKATEDRSPLLGWQVSESTGSGQGKRPRRLDSSVDLQTINRVRIAPWTTLVSQLRSRFATASKRR